MVNAGTASDVDMIYRIPTTACGGDGGEGRKKEERNKEGRKRKEAVRCRSVPQGGSSIVINNTPNHLRIKNTVPPQLSISQIATHLPLGSSSHALAEALCTPYVP